MASKTLQIKHQPTELRAGKTIQFKHQPPELMAGKTLQIKHQPTELMAGKLFRSNINPQSWRQVKLFRSSINPQSGRQVKLFRSSINPQSGRQVKLFRSNISRIWYVVLPLKHTITERIIWINEKHTNWILARSYISFEEIFVAEFWFWRTEPMVCGWKLCVKVNIKFHHLTFLPM